MIVSGQFGAIVGICPSRAWRQLYWRVIKGRPGTLLVTDGRQARVSSGRAHITRTELVMKIVYILLFCLWAYWSFSEFQRGNTTAAVIYLAVGVALLAWRMKRLKT